MSTSPRAVATTIASLGEHGLLARLRARVPPPPAWIPIGIGDDAAVIEPARGELDVLTTDSLIEGVHFRRDWTALDAVGYKALAVNLSDLAAMGAAPRAALLSLALPPDLAVDAFDALLDGFLGLAAQMNVPLAGGNLAQSPGPIVVGVTLLGSARRRRVLTRSAARQGDELYVTGSLGAAATGLAIRRNGQTDTMTNTEFAACVERYERPAPRLRWGVTVARNRAASACVDLSDGLADAVTQIAEASRVGAVVVAGDVPVHAGTTEWVTRTGGQAVHLAISGGEDYELLFAVPKKRRSRFLAIARALKDVPVTRVGRVTAEPGLWLERDGAREPLGRGFAHF